VATRRKRQTAHRGFFRTDGDDPKHRTAGDEQQGARRNTACRRGPNADGSPLRFDVLRLQRLAAPVTVYIEQFSAHPLERDFAELYAPPDGYLDSAGVFTKRTPSADDKPVYEVTLQPGDGLYPLPYMARQANGQAWEMDGTEKNAPAELCRVPFFPDGSRLVRGNRSAGNFRRRRRLLLSGKADFDFYRALPSGGYAKGRSAGERTDIGAGDIAPETRGVDFFPYRPGYLRKEPPMAALASDQYRPTRARRAASIWARSGSKAAHSSKRQRIG
jgi:L-asparaginase